MQVTSTSIQSLSLRVYFHFNPSTLPWQEFLHIDSAFITGRVILKEVCNRAKPDHMELDYAEPNQGLHRQIIIWDLCSSEILRSAEWSFCTDILGQPISPIVKSQEIQKRGHSLTEDNWHNLILGGA
jgi:hypothetical protein